MKKTSFMKGKFTPNNPTKYVGDVNNIVYRSSWELAFLRILDSNPNVLRYASEELAIKYYNPIKTRWARYFPDFLIEVKVGDQIKKKLVEIKPAHELAQPRQSKGKKFQTYLNEMTTYSVNQAKWKAASEWCRTKGIEFVVVSRAPNNSKFIYITEEQLGLKTETIK